MSSYPKPPREYAIFDPTIFNVSRYLEFPVAQGAETLQAITVKGLAIFQAFANFQGILVNGTATFSSYITLNGIATFNAESIFNSFIRIRDGGNQSTLDQITTTLTIQNEAISGNINLQTKDGAGTTITPLQLSSASSTFDTDVNFNYNLYIKDGSNNTLIDQSITNLNIENQVISGNINLQTKNSSGTTTTPLQLSSASSTFSNDVNFNGIIHVKDGGNVTLIDQSATVLNVENQVTSGTINLKTKNSSGTTTTPISITTPLITVNSPTDFIDVINSKNSINIYDSANLSKYSILDQIGNDLVINNNVNSGFTTFSNKNGAGALRTPFKVNSDGISLYSTTTSTSITQNGTGTDFFNSDANAYFNFSTIDNFNDFTIFSISKLNSYFRSPVSFLNTISIVDGSNPQTLIEQNSSTFSIKNTATSGGTINFIINSTTGYKTPLYISNSDVNCNTLLYFRDGANDSSISQEATNIVLRNYEPDGNYYFKSKVGATEVDTMVLQSNAASGSLLYITDVNGNQSYFQNNSNNLNIRQTNPNGTIAFYTSDGTGNMLNPLNMTHDTSTFYNDLKISNKYLYLYDVVNDNNKYSKIDQENEYFVIRNEAISGQIAFFVKDSAGTSVNRMNITNAKTSITNNIDFTGELKFLNPTTTIIGTTLATTSTGTLNIDANDNGAEISFYTTTSSGTQINSMRVRPTEVYMGVDLNLNSNRITNVGDSITFNYPGTSIIGTQIGTTPTGGFSIDANDNGESISFYTTTSSGTQIKSMDVTPTEVYFGVDLNVNSKNITNVNNLVVNGSIIGNIPNTASGLWLGTNSTGEFNTNTVTPNFIYMTPIRLEKDSTITAIGVRVLGGINAASAGFSIYQNQQANGMPSTRVLAPVYNTNITSAINNIGGVTLGTPLILTSGFYWLGVRFSSVGTVANTIPRYITNGICSGTSCYDANDGVVSSGILYSTAAGDPFPTSLPTPSGYSSNGGSPVCLIKIQ